MMLFKSTNIPHSDSRTDKSANGTNKGAVAQEEREREGKREIGSERENGRVITALYCEIKALSQSVPAPPHTSVRTSSFPHKYSQS